MKNDSKRGRGPSDSRGLPLQERVRWSNMPRRRPQAGGPSGKSSNGGAPPLFTVDDTHDPSFGKVGITTNSAALGPYKRPMPPGRTKVRG